MFTRLQVNFARAIYCFLWGMPVVSCVNCQCESCLFVSLHGRTHSAVLSTVCYLLELPSLAAA